MTSHYCFTPACERCFPSDCMALANYSPYSTLTDAMLHRLAALNPTTLATMHGSTFIGDGARALQDLR